MNLRSLSTVARRHRPLLRFLAGAAWLSGLPLYAQAALAADEEHGSYADLGIEELMQLPVDTVYGASKYAQKVTQAPASISIISADEIRKQGHRTLADVLRSVRGMYVTYDRNYDNLGARGFARPGDFNTRLLLLIDGHRLNDNLYSSALVGIEAIVDVEMIERVEVIRGPSSSIYGDSAFFGVINVVTREASRIDGLEAAASAGSLDTYQARLAYGRKFGNGLDLTLSGSAYDSAGNGRLYYPEFDTPETNRGVAEDADGEDAYRFFARAGYGRFTLSGAYSLREKDIPTASYSTVFNDGRERAEDESIYVDLKYAQPLAEGELTGRVYYDRYGYFADYPYDFAAPGDEPFVVLLHGDSHGAGVGSELQLTQTLFDRHTVVAGVEHREGLNLYQSTYADDPSIYDVRDRRRSRSTGVYLQDDFMLIDRLRVNAGLRYDRYDRFGGELSPRLGLIYSAGQNTTVKLLFGQGYRAPNAYEKYQETPSYSKANPELEPETIRTYEAVVEHYFASNLRAGVSAYRYHIEDLISQQVDPADGLRYFENLDEVSADGLELELEGRYARGLMARISYALQRARDDDSGRRLDSSPAQLGKLNLTLPLYQDHVHGSLELQYSSSTRSLAGSTIDGFLVTNMTLFGQQVFPNLDLSASVYNLFDASYAYSGSSAHVQEVIPQDGRGFRIKATYRF